MITKWGVPDGFDKRDYKGHEKWPLYRWRWEFTRRRKDYREDFQRYAPSTVEELRQRRPPPELGGFLAVNEPGFVAEISLNQIHEFLSKYGLMALPNPAIGEQPWTVLRFETPHRQNVVEGKGPSQWELYAKEPHDPWWDEHFRSPYDMEFSRLMLREDRPDTKGSLPEAWHNDEPKYVNVPRGTAAVMLDISQPIDEQWSCLRAHVMKLQKNQLGKIVRTRIHKQKWLRYLRVIDARDAHPGSWLKLAKIALSEHDVRPTPQRVRRVWEQGQRLMFSWRY